MTHGEVLAVLCVEIVCWMMICAGKHKDLGGSSAAAGKPLFPYV